MIYWDLSERYMQTLEGRQNPYLLQAIVRHNIRRRPTASHLHNKSSLVEEWRLALKPDSAYSPWSEEVGAAQP